MERRQFLERIIDCLGLRMVGLGEARMYGPFAMVANGLERIKKAARLRDVQPKKE